MFFRLSVSLFIVDSVLRQLIRLNFARSNGLTPRIVSSPSSKKAKSWGAWVAQSVERPTSAQVMIPRFVSLSPASGSVLTARSPEPASDSVSPSLSAPSLLMLCLSLSLKKKKNE